MTKNKIPVRYTGQHFTIDKVLIKDAIKQANLTQHDTVLDIGAGKGFLTVQLLENVNKIIAIEKDLTLIKYLHNRFSNIQRVKIVGCDFRTFTIPKYPFKVVSNIPYRITSEIFKILMFDNIENFLGGSIVLQFEPAKKIISNRIHNPITVLYHTFFDIKLLYEVKPDSFLPPPTVKSALLKIERKQTSLEYGLKGKYLTFISFFLRKPDLLVNTAFKSLFRKNQIRIISQKFGINLNAQIVCLTPNQWEKCFLEMLEVVPEKFHPS